MNKRKKLPVHFTVVLKKLKNLNMQTFINEVKLFKKSSIILFINIYNYSSLFVRSKYLMNVIIIYS